MKTIYIVSGCMDCESCHPEEAFLSKQRAEEFKKLCESTPDEYFCDYYMTSAVILDEEI